MTVASGCPGVFSIRLSHTGVQDYFLIDCHTQVSRSMIVTVDTANTVDTDVTVDTVDIVDTADTVDTVDTVGTGDVDVFARLLKKWIACANPH